MKKGFAMLVAFVLLFGCAALAETTAGFTIVLEENPTTGYLWTALPADEAVVSVIDGGYVQEAGTEDLCGAGGTHTWVLEGKAEGQTAVTFTLTSPSGEIDSVSIYYVRVNADKAIHLIAVDSQGDDENPNHMSIALAENPTTGYTWEYTASTDNLLEDEMDPESAFVAGDPELDGAPGVHRWAFRGLAEGDVTLNFVYAQHFDENAEPYATISYQLHVDDTGRITLLGMDGEPQDLLLSSMK